jgi:TonB family protein
LRHFEYWATLDSSQLRSTKLPKINELLEDSEILGKTPQYIRRWHRPCIFQPGVFLSGEEQAMKRTLTFATLGLALLLAGSVALPSKVLAQDDASTDAAKRKVRTKVVPEYPQLAKQMNVTGKVKIEATIAADGHVVNTRVVGGSPLLVNAALDALKRWRFEPAPRDTTEVVEFTFNGQ